MSSGQGREIAVCLLHRAITGITGNARCLAGGHLQAEIKLPGHLRIQLDAQAHGLQIAQSARTEAGHEIALLTIHFPDIEPGRQIIHLRLVFKINPSNLRFAIGPLRRRRQRHAR